MSTYTLAGKQYTLPAHVVGYWPFVGGPSDYSGLNRPLIETGPLTYGAQSVTGFSASNYLSLDPATFGAVLTGAFTLDLVVNFTAGYSGTFFAADSPSGPGMFYLKVAAGKVYMEDNGDSSTPTTIPFGVETKLRVVRDGITVFLYIDGTLSGSLACLEIFDTTSTIYLGPSLTGSISSARLYDVALTSFVDDTEVLDTYVNDGAKAFEMKGLDLTDRVTSWGTLEEIKETATAKAELFVGTLAMTVDNSDDAFSPGAIQKVTPAADYTLVGKDYALYSPDDLLAYYEFEQSGQDWSGNRKDLTTVGTVPYASVTGQRGAYAAGPFSAPNYFTLNKALLQGRSVWSMVIRFTSDNTTAAYQYLYHFADGTNNCFIRKNITTGNLLWCYGNALKNITVASPLAAGEHKIVVVNSGTQATLWLDGQLKATALDALPIPNPLGYAYFGVTSGPGSPWLGTISSLRLYSRALTDYELATPLADNVAYYGMQQSGADWSGQKNHLTTVGNVPYALQSDGTYAAGPFVSNTYFKQNFTNTAGVGRPGSFSFCCSIYPLSTPTSQVWICDSQNDMATEIGLSFYPDSTCSLAVYNSIRGVSAGVIPLNAWTRITATYDFSTGISRIYKNGSFAAQSSPSFNFPSTGVNTFSIGTTTLNTTRVFPGYISSFSVYSRALTPAEIAADYAASFPPALTGSEVALMTADTADVQAIETVTSSSFLGRNNWVNTPGIITLNDKTVFTGPLKKIKCDSKSRLATLTFENTLSIPADTSVEYTATNVNPVRAMLTLFDNAGLLDLVDTASFAGAAGPSIQGGAVVSIAIKESDDITLLSVIQQLSELANVSVYVHNGVIMARAFRPYTGGGMGPELKAEYVREFGERETADSAFFTSCTVAYGSGGLTEKYTSLSAMAINGNKEKIKTFDTKAGENISVADSASAYWFAQNYMGRAGVFRDTVNLTVGTDHFPSVSIGERYPITHPHWGFDKRACEVVEMHRELGSTDVTLKLVTLD